MLALRWANGEATTARQTGPQGTESAEKPSISTRIGLVIRRWPPRGPREAQDGAKTAKPIVKHPHRLLVWTAFFCSRMKVFLVPVLLAGGRREPAAMGGLKCPVEKWGGENEEE